MNRGRIEQLAPPQELYAQPRTAFVADFIGSANILSAQQQHELKLTSIASSSIMLRREAVRILEGAPADHTSTPNHLSVTGTCERSLFMGDRCEVLLKVNDALSLRGVSDRPIKPGAPAYAHIDPSAARTLEA